MFSRIPISRKEKRKFVILRALSHSEGYTLEIFRSMLSVTGGMVHQSVVQNLLHDMVQAGLISLQNDPLNKNVRPRYRLTKCGQELLKYDPAARSP